MLRSRMFGLVALLLLATFSGCQHMGGCSSCSRSASASGCASCASRAAAPIPAPTETGSFPLAGGQR